MLGAKWPGNKSGTVKELKTIPQSMPIVKMPTQAVTRASKVKRGNSGGRKGTKIYLT